MIILDCTCILLKFSKKKYSGVFLFLNEIGESILENFNVKKELHRKNGLLAFDFAVRIIWHGF